MKSQSPLPPEEITEALRLLDKRNLVLAIHDPSFPASPGDDLGRGTPYTPGGLEFLRFARQLGFNGIQLGPQGQTGRTNQSPYDATVFSRSVLAISYGDLAWDPAWGGLLDERTLDALTAANPGRDGRRVAYAHAYEAAERALDAAVTALRDRRRTGDPHAEDLARDMAAFRRASWDWLERDALFDVLAHRHGTTDWQRWPREGDGSCDRRLFDPEPGQEAACRARRNMLLEQGADRVERYVFAQYVAHRQHHAFRDRIQAWGLKLFGDMQVGLSAGDAWALQGAILSGWRLGAPPSRTNPDGQPWGMPVLDPDRYFEAGGRPGPALRLFWARVEKMLAEYDGVRIDHPHGLVCPWVYRADAPEPHRAVRDGARLFESPDLPEYPELAAWAIARADQLDRGRPRHADDWVRELDADQVGRYAVLIDAIVDAARLHGRDVSDLVCEVLSTRPRPLAEVMARHGMGRFRVTQKADVRDPANVYRSDNARPEDWIMVDNHDTAPIWRLAASWVGTEDGRARAAYLAGRLHPEHGRAEAEARMARDARHLVHAHFADLFASPARNVMVFFPDLLGMQDVYNAPGTVNDENWTLRVPPGFEGVYGDAAAAGRALDLPRVLAMALRSRGSIFARQHAGLIARLDRLSSWQE